MRNLPESWTPDERTSLRAYLEQHPNFLRALSAMVPSITGDTLEAKAMSGSQHQGAEDLIKTIREMSAKERTPEGESDYIDPTID